MSQGELSRFSEKKLAQLAQFAANIPPKGAAMKNWLIGFLLFLLFQTSGFAQGDSDAGRMLWENPSVECRYCHGVKGEGAWGPILAGRNLNFLQFQQAMRKPVIKPPSSDTPIPDREVENLLAYMNSLPMPAQHGPWRNPVPENAPSGARTAIATIGCAQCHGVVFASPRQGIGAVNGDFEWF